MTDSALIDRIVAGVLEQLQPQVATRAESPSAGTIVTPAKSPKAAAPPPASQSISSAAAPAAKISLPANEIGVPQAVVTAAVLDGLKLPSGAALILAPKAVVTPTAQDWLRQRKVTWRRGRAAASSQTANGMAQWMFLASTVTGTVRSLMEQLSRSFPSWRRQLAGAATESAETAIRLITSAECQRVLIVSAASELVACRANRSDRVRATVIDRVDRLSELETTLSPNVLVVNPQAKSLMELRHVVQACDKLPAPKNLL